MGFDSFLGNPQAVAAVREMLAGGRVPGALLFAGPEGVGKKTLALMMAKAHGVRARPRGLLRSVRALPQSGADVSPPRGKIWRAAAKARIPRAGSKAWFTSIFRSSSR